MQDTDVVLMVVLAGQVICGAWLSVTVTLNEQVGEAVLPAASTAVKVTAVVPFWKVILPLLVPSAIPEIFVGLLIGLPEKLIPQVAPEQLSETGSLNEVTAVQALLGVVKGILPGQLTVGRVSS